MPVEVLQAKLYELQHPTETFAIKYRRFKLKPPWFHQRWYSTFDNPAYDRVYLPGPREHAKTSTVLTYVLRRLAENHQLRVGIISGTDRLAMNFMNEVKHELTSNWALMRDYNKGLAMQGDKWTEHDLVLADAREGPNGISGKDVSLFSVGRGSQISSRHCDLLVVDDIEQADTVRSEEVRKGTREYWAREVSPVLSPGGKLIVLGSRKHYDDLYSHLISGDTDITGEGAIWYTEDCAKSVWRDGMEGVPIWPEFWSLERLLRRKAELDRVDVLAWPQEYLNEPRPSNDQMFDPDQWPIYKKVPFGLAIIQYWDLAISEKTSSDYTVGITIGVDPANNVYILELQRGHWDFNRTLALIEDMGKRWAAAGDLQAVAIEQVAYQAAAVQEAVRRTMLPIIPDPVKGADKDKVARAKLAEARAKAGKVLRPAQARWWADFVAEAKFFPDGAHDDQVDAFSGAVRIAGVQAGSISWAYNVYTCANCKNMFMWEPKRPCPKCHTPAPEVYENPELVDWQEHMAAMASGNGQHADVPEEWQ